MNSNCSINVISDDNGSAFFKVEGREELCLGKSDPQTIWLRKCIIIDKGMAILTGLRHNEYIKM